MAKMTLAEQTTRLRGIICEPGSDRFPDEDSATLGIGLYTLLSDGMRAFCSETGWTKSTASITVTGNDTVSDSTRIYSLPSDCLAIDTNDVTYDGVRIFPLTKKELHVLDIDYDSSNTNDTKWIELAGTPEYFYMEKEDIIGLYPAPDADNDGKTLHISYHEDPGAVTTSTDESPILWDLTWGAIYFAASKVFENDSNPINADRYEVKFWNTVQRAIRRKSKYLRRSPLIVKSHRQYTVHPDKWTESVDVDLGSRES